MQLSSNALQIVNNVTINKINGNMWLNSIKKLGTFSNIIQTVANNSTIKLFHSDQVVHGQYFLLIYVTSKQKWNVLYYFVSKLTTQKQIYKWFAILLNQSQQELKVMRNKFNFLVKFVDSYCKFS